MEKQLIFIDDSGDPGFKPASSPNFVMAAAVFDNPETADSLSKAISTFRHSLGWNKACEFKFAKDRKTVTKSILHLITQYDFQIYASYINKANFHNVIQIIDNKKTVQLGHKGATRNNSTQ